ncbi:MAG TPA: hypothetical protein PKI19_04575 [Elusimicrobiales bacterium]|nr:hypothetical protein [Elusimicrobiales bacterium]
MKLIRVFLIAGIVLTPATAFASNCNGVLANAMLFPVLFSGIAALVLRSKIRRRPDESRLRTILRAIFWMTAIPGYIAFFDALIGKDPVVINVYSVLLAGFATASYFAFRTLVQAQGEPDAAAKLNKTVLKWAIGLVVFPALIVLSGYWLFS